MASPPLPSSGCLTIASVSLLKSPKEFWNEQNVTSEEEDNLQNLLGDILDVRRRERGQKGEMGDAEEAGAGREGGREGGGGERREEEGGGGKVQ
eukprot:568450-Hanusia_phi.AAC.1